jgi:hypothetical protein
MLVVVTPQAMRSEWVRLEVQTAKTFAKPIVPLLVGSLNAPADERTYAGLGLAELQYRDFTRGYEADLPHLLADLPQPQAGLPGYCQKLIARLADTPWGLDHYIQEEAKLLPIHASPYDEGLRRGPSQNLLHHLWRGKRTRCAAGGR